MYDFGEQITRQISELFVNKIAHIYCYQERFKEGK